MVLVTSLNPSHQLAGWGAYAIRALPDLCRGIVSGRLGHFLPRRFSLWSHLESPGTPGAFERDLLDRASHFSEPQIDRFVMAITSFEARVRHTTPRRLA